MSGVGKSTLLDMIASKLSEDPSVVLLQFKFEMLPTDELTRLASARTSKSLKEIYSKDTPLDDETFAEVKTFLNTLKKREIYTVENTGTPSEIIHTVLNFVERFDWTNKGIVVTLDHTLLIKGDDEKRTVDQFMKDLVGLKKHLASKGVNCIFIILSQLNRSIETPERSSNCFLHYPNKNDIFSASSVYYSSDYVLIIHKPCLIDGISEWYGPPLKGHPKGLPVYNPLNEEQPMIYLHLIKERFGLPKILAMLDQLENSRIEEA